MARFKEIGLTAAYPNRRATHEFIISLKPEAKRYHLTAMDFAKRLLDFGIHAPTTYFPLLIPECWLVEPTETETKEELDQFIAVMQQLQQEAEANPAMIKTAPHTLSVRRLDDVYAAKILDVKWSVPSIEILV